MRFWRRIEAGELRGWIALGISTAIAALWAFWGVLENFHEGWWMPGLGKRLLFTIAYMTPMLICLVMLAAAIFMPRIGAIIYFLVGGIFSWFVFRERWDHLTIQAFLSWVPVTLLLVGVGVLWWLATVRRRRLAYLIGIGVPLATMIAFGIEPAWRVAHRVDDGDRSARAIRGDGIELIWAPAGPGWVRDAKHACDWRQAIEICSRLTEDGTALADSTLGVWRLPTVDELVRSSARHGRNAGGEWDSAAARARYRIRPDKESPLWDTRGETIYWWTATDVGEEQAYRYVYDGKVYRTPKDLRLGTLGFRAVREP